MKTIFNFILLFFVITSDSFGQVTWISTNGPINLVVEDFVIDKQSRLFLSASNSGVYISKDQGLNWEKLNSGLPYNQSYATKLAVSIYGELYGLFENNLWILDSLNVTWKQLSFNDSYTELYTGYDGSVFVAKGYLYREFLISKDHGRNFTLLLNSNSLTNAGTISLNGSNKNYFAERDGVFYNIYKVNDDGSNLQRIYRGAINLTNIYFHPSGYLFLTDPFFGMIRIDSIGKNPLFLNSTLESVSHLFIMPDASIVCLTQKGDFSSIDTGRTWNKLSTKYSQSVYFKERAFLDDTVLYYLDGTCLDIGLSKTVDGGLNWQNIHSNFTNGTIGRLFLSHANILYAQYCANNIRYDYSYDQGQSWLPFIFSANNESYIDLQIMGNGNMFLVSQYGIQVSYDNGQTWDKLQIQSESDFQYITSDLKNVIMVSKSGKSYISWDGGINWNLVNTPIREIGKLLIHPDGDYFCLEGNHNYHTIHRSIDRGINWTETRVKNLPLNDCYINNKGLIFYSFDKTSAPNNGFHVSYDKLFSSKLINPEAFYSITGDENGVLFGAVQSGLCKYSIDDGKTWNDINDGLPEKNKSTQIVIDNDNYLYISFFNDAVYRSTKPVNIATGISFQQANDEINLFPNPVTEILKLSMNDLNEPIIGVSILDITGKLIEVMEFETRNSYLMLTVKNLNPGSYLIEINLNNGIKIKSKFLKI